MIPFRIALALVSCAASLAAQTVLVKPYVQSTDDGTGGARDTKLLVWFTDQVPGEFTVEFGAGDAARSKVSPSRIAINLDAAPPGFSVGFFSEPFRGIKLFKYTATLANLPLDARVNYRVKLRDTVIRENSFPTRKSAAGTLRFTVAGDMADGLPDQRRISYEIWKTKPDLMLVVGDIIYPAGTVSEYFDHFWNEYNNTDNADPAVGTPLMASTLWHVVLGNHDIWSHNIGLQPDGLAAFYFFHAPPNGPKKLSPYIARFRSPEFTMSTRAWTNTLTGFLPVSGPPAQVAAFTAASGGAFPGLCFYAFENGPALFLCLDANSYTNPGDLLLQAWIRARLTQSRARWKFVFFHQPGFHSSAMHYEDQRMRVLAPLFEECGVDVVFSGHIHNYQRSKPLKFKPAPEGLSHERGTVNGQFTLDENFDGARVTTPKGIIYVVTGGGGASLYDYPIESDSFAREYYKGNWAPFNARSVGDRHSFSHVEVGPDAMIFTQIDDSGREIERVKITKGK